MKLLFESWRQYLNESSVDPHAQTKLQKLKKPEYEGDEYGAPYEHEETEDKTRERYFGTSPDSIGCVKDLRDPKKNVNPSDFYECMADEGYKKINAGSFRAAFTNPSNPDLVLKIVTPETMLENPWLEGAGARRSMNMNYAEARASYQTASDLVPKVYDSARDYFWIMSERVIPITSWRDMKTFFPIWRAGDQEDFNFYFHKLISEDRDEEDLVDTLDKRIEYVKSGEELVNDPLILQIRDLLAQFDAPVWDIRPHNVGYATRDGKKQFVVLDPGFELTKDTKEKQPGSSKSFSDIFKDKYGKTWKPEKTKKAKALTERLMLKPGLDGWDKYRELVAKAYDDAPLYDENAVSEFEGIKPFVDKMFKRISSRVDIQFVDEDPYEGPEDMCDDALNNGILKIWSGGTEHQIFDPEINLKLRAVHDYMAHCQRKTDFTMKGEVAAYNSHMKTVPPSSAGALFTEVVGQAAFFLEYKYFPPQKIAILEGFDFFNVGEVDPEITGYKLDRKEKKLVSVKAPEPEKEEIQEDYQKKVIKRHRKMKIRLIGKGKNTYNVGGKMKKPSYRRAKSAPAGAGGT